MAEPTFHDVFKVYPNRNSPLRGVVKKAFEFGANVSKEQGAAMSSGLQDAEIKRQRDYVARIRAEIERLAAKPIPDNPRSHPMQFPVDLSTPYVTFTQDVGGNQIPINEDAQVLAESWATLCVELSLSESAALGGSLLPFDKDRALNNVAVIEEKLDEIESNDLLDMAETNLTNSSYGGTGRKTGA
jgi:hypothetical protein